MSPDSPDMPPAATGSLDAVAAEGRRRARRLAWLYAGAALILLPWIGFLAVTLPKRQFDLHYRAAWVGFDVLLVFAIARTAYMAFRVDERVQFPATATATLLIVDAWFDITTSGGHGQFFESVLLAVCIEIPAALFSLHVARQVNRSCLEQVRLAESVFAPVPDDRRRRRRRIRSTDASGAAEPG